MDDDTCQLYRHFDDEGTLLYVGVSLSATKRFGEHTRQSHWSAAIANMTVENYKSRHDALKAETYAIQSEHPLHNTQHKKSEDRCRHEREYDEMIMAREQLTNYIVNVQPMYRLDELRPVLGLGKAAVERVIEQGHLGSVKITSPKNKMGFRRMVTGWQVIDFIEKWSGGLEINVE